MEKKKDIPPPGASTGSKSKHGKSKLQNVGDWINERYEIRNNEVSAKIEFRKKGSHDEFAQLNENNIYVELESEHIDVSMTKLKALLHSDFVESYNPFLHYLDNLKVWDKDKDKDYISILCSYIPAEDKDRFKNHFTKMLVRSIACALDDRYFNKQAFILVHDMQNSGKSTFCRWLCPPALEGYIAENISTDKDGLIALSTNFIINMDELATMAKAEINMLKSFLSKDRINVRLPYGERTVTMPRRANFVGSTNKDEFLTDETGSARWLCFRLTGKINFDYSKDIQIDDLWRQAYFLYKSGFRFQLTQSEVEENEKSNRTFLVTTTEMELITKYFKPATAAKYEVFYTATDIAEYIAQKSHNTPKLYIEKIGKALKILGHTQSTTRKLDLDYPIKGYYLDIVIQP